MRLIQSGILRRNPGSRGSQPGMTDEESRGRSGAVVEGCGTHCWLHPAHPAGTGDCGSSGEAQWQISAAPGLEPDPRSSGRPETQAWLICTARTRRLAPPPMDFHFPTVAAPLFVVPLLPGTSVGSLFGLGAMGGMF